MKKFLFLIIAIMTFTLHAIADEPTPSTSSSQGIMLEIAQYKETPIRHRSPMRITIEACYNAETNSIEISYDGEAEGEVFLYLNGDIIDYGSDINTSFVLPQSSGLYRIEIISEIWIAEGYIQL